MKRPHATKLRRTDMVSMRASKQLSRSEVHSGAFALRDFTRKPSLLKRAQRLFERSGEHDKTVAAPAQPMSDRDLALAIRAFQKTPVPEWITKKLGKRFHG